MFSKGDAWLLTSSAVYECLSEVSTHKIGVTAQEIEDYSSAKFVWLEKCESQDK